MPELHELTGDSAPPEESDEDRAERIYRNSMAWVVVTGGTTSSTVPEIVSGEEELTGLADDNPTA